jgi:hypothetical protein
MRIPLRSCNAALLCLATSSCIVQRSTSTPLTESAAAEPRSSRCSITRFDSEHDVPAHRNLSLIEVTCANGRQSETICWSEVRRQACAAGADFVHHTTVGLYPSGIVITTTAAATRY